MAPEPETAAPTVQAADGGAGPALGRHLLGPLAGAAGALIAFWGLGAQRFSGWILDLGSIFWPPPITLAFYLTWALCGAALAVALTLAAERLLTARPAITTAWLGGSEREFLLAASLLAFVVPFLVRRLALGDGDITDDESAYRFMAELLASGRLWVASPELKLFFDRAFMVNDGKLYAGYFVGWPALMAPAVPLGWTGYVNAVLAALAIPAIFRLLRERLDAAWARAGALLAATAPLLVFGAATELSHTSCFTALAWAWWFADRAARPDATWRHDAALASCFAIAFFVRPLSALGIALPLLLVWQRDRWHDAARRPARLLAFAAPAALFSAAFLFVQWVQTGSALMPAYNRLLAYSAENAFRFAAFGPEALAHTGNFRFDGWLAALGNTVTGLLRLNFDLFGWWSSFALVALARGPLARLAWWSVACFVLLHLFVSDPGIDSFAPVHAYELALPILLLTVRGAADLGAWASRHLGRPQLAAALLLALVLSALVGFVPVRLRALARLAENATLPVRAAAAADLGPALVFAPRPFAPPCRSAPTRHFVYFRPNNDPDLENPVLWVNHLDLPRDRELAARFPHRRPFLMTWIVTPAADGQQLGADDASAPACDVAFLPLDQLEEGMVAPGLADDIRTLPES